MSRLHVTQKSKNAQHFTAGTHIYIYIFIYMYYVLYNILLYKMHQ